MSDNLLINSSFEDWITLDGGNQQPNGWKLSWLASGVPNYGLGYYPHIESSDTEPSETDRTPECVHREVWQLPPEERPDGSDPLILYGGAVYKMFGASGAFGAQLSLDQELEEGAEYTLHANVRIHWHAGSQPDMRNAAIVFSSSSEDSTQSMVVRGDVIGDRSWRTIQYNFTYQGVLDIKFCALYPSAGVDFFVDGWSLLRVNVAPNPLRLVWDTTVTEQENNGIRINKEGALFRKLSELPPQYNVVINETYFMSQGDSCVAIAAEDPAGELPRVVVFAKVGDWDNVMIITEPSHWLNAVI